LISRLDVSVVERVPVSCPGNSTSPKIATAAVSVADIEPESLADSITETAGVSVTDRLPESETAGYSKGGSTGVYCAVHVTIDTWAIFRAEGEPPAEV
jgi:hypothetical protein